MNLIIAAITTLVLTTSVASLQQLIHERPPSHGLIGKIVEQLSSQASRRVDLAKLNQAKHLYKRLKKAHLREKTSDDPTIEEAEKNEKELTSALKQVKAAVEEQPFIEHKGKHDYLVMATVEGDRFVTVVPNNIYYNIEKKCVNWLDDCSLKGIRQRLLRGVLSPV